MKTLIMDYEPYIRLFFFFGILIIMAVWEVLTPRRSLKNRKSIRWYSNLGLVVIDSLALRLLLPIQAVGVALYVETHGWGIFNIVLLPKWMSVILGVFCLDFVIYLQHAMFHFIPALWRLHRVHHTDLDFDVTTGIRFHPVEILLSMGIKMGAVAFFGVSPIAVVIFEVLLNATSMFNHGNVRFPKNIDRLVRLFIVTPEMHRVHHSVLIREFNSNFGFNLPWWDRLLGTYRDQPEAGHEGMTIGLGPFRDPNALTLSRLLILPFLRK